VHSINPFAMSYVGATYFLTALTAVLRWTNIVIQWPLHDPIRRGDKCIGRPLGYSAAHWHTIR